MDYISSNTLQESNTINLSAFYRTIFLQPKIFNVGGTDTRAASQEIVHVTRRIFKNIFLEGETRHSSNQFTTRLLVYLFNSLDLKGPKIPNLFFSFYFLLDNGSKLIIH